MSDITSESEARSAFVAALRDLVAGKEKDDGRVKDPNAFKQIKAEVRYDGKVITLPDDPRRMTLREGRDWLLRLEQADEEVIAVHEEIDAHPWDGAVALMKAMQRTYGWASPAPTPGFFGPEPPAMVAIETAVDETATIFWGSFRLPGLSDTLLTCQADQKSGNPRFIIGGQTKRKYVEAIHELAEVVRQIVRSESIYRGKAIRLIVNDEGQINFQAPPKFVDLRRVNPAELVFSNDLQRQVDTNLWTPIEHTEICRLHNVPLKRGVLLEGEYGTGKSLCSMVTAVKCEANKWTFVTVPHAKALKSALQFAQRYQPCVVFVEDIDRQLSGERTHQMDDTLNVVDGIISKNAEVMVVLTSNNVEAINRAMLRPGRLDAILHIAAPDAGAVQKLLRIYGRDRIKQDTTLEKAGVALAGQIPAVIREAVERSKLYAISQRPGTDWHLTDEDIEAAAKGMEYHLKLLKGKDPEAKSHGDKIAESLAAVLSEHLANGHDNPAAKLLKKLSKETEELHKHVVG